MYGYRVCQCPRLLAACNCCSGCLQVTETGTCMHRVELASIATLSQAERLHMTTHHANARHIMLGLVGLLQHCRQRTNCLHCLPLKMNGLCMAHACYPLTTSTSAVFCVPVALPQRLLSPSSPSHGIHTGERCHLQKLTFTTGAAVTNNSHH
jgi:hypothetical protein